MATKIVTYGSTVVPVVSYYTKREQEFRFPSLYSKIKKFFKVRNSDSRVSKYRLRKCHKVSTQLLCITVHFPRHAILTRTGNRDASSSVLRTTYYHRASVEKCSANLGDNLAPSQIANLGARVAFNGNHRCRIPSSDNICFQGIFCLVHYSYI